MQKPLLGNENRVLANRYRIEKKLGSGNFGVAYLVTDLKHNDELKVLKEVSVGDMQPDDTVESVHEANLLSKLDHPYIVHYHDSFLDGEYFCIVTEYCEGADLDVRFKQLKKENKRLSEKQVLDWFVQLLSAVHYMHSRKVLHRDLKARNIFIRNETMKIGDFGISRILMGTMDMATTFTGTPYYMSPEVLKHEGYNSKSDVWSLGCLLYEMCTFEHAFEGQGLMGVMYKIVEGKIPDLPSIYSRDLNSILKKIFRKDPGQRPSTAELLHEPYIVNHIKDMIERLSSGKPLTEAESTITVKNSAADIAKSLNTKYHVKDLRAPKPSESPQHKIAEDDLNDDDDEDTITNNIISNTNSQTIGGNKTMKDLTPKERMILNKLKKADEEAKKIGQMAKENYEERLMRDSFRRETTMNAGTHARVAIQPGYGQQIDHSYFPRNAQQSYHPQAYQSKNLNEVSSDDDGNYDVDDDEGTILKTIQNYRLDDSLTATKTQSPMYNNNNGSKHIFITEQTGTFATVGGSKTYRLVDDRPIKPMKTRIEVNSFDDDGIPMDPNLANEYYKQFNDFDDEESKSPDRSSRSTKQLRNSLSKTVLPPAQQRRLVSGAPVKPSNAANVLPPIGLTKQKTEMKIQSKTISNSNPRGSHASRAEYEQLINVMQTALAKADATETFGDDEYSSVFGHYARDTKVQNLRAQAVRLLGEQVFKKCYEFLKTERSGKHTPDESKILEGLRKITPNTRDCFLIDQLIFLEDQAR